MACMITNAFEIAHITVIKSMIHKDRIASLRFFCVHENMVDLFLQYQDWEIHFDVCLCLLLREKQHN